MFSPVRTPRFAFVLGCLYAAVGISVTPASSQTPMAWGNNVDGELGDGTTTDRLTPVQVTGLANVAAVSAFGLHSLALRTDGTVWSWGKNFWGELGDGTTTNRLTPVQVPGLSNVTAVSAGGMHSLALKADGTVWAWGSNQYDQLGDGTTTNRLTPVQVSGLSNVAAVSAGGENGLALKTDGTVWAWGNNSYGQLGDGTTTDRLSPVQVPGLSNVAAVSAGGENGLALKTDGTVWAWGNNDYGQLGDGTTTDRVTPVQVPGLSNVAAASAGVHSLALKTDGTVWAWGSNNFGELGDGTTTNRLTPVQVTSLSNVTAVSAGLSDSLALRTDGTVWSWGKNFWGELGDGTTTNRLTPVQVPGLSNVAAVSAGSTHSLASKEDRPGTLALQATLAATPSAVPSDGATTSRITLTYRRSGQVASRRTIRFVSSRGAADTFSAATAITDANGQASTTVKSSTAGVATITCRDETAGVDLPAFATVQFSNPGGVWVNCRFLQPRYPFTDRDPNHWESTLNTYDGNSVKIDAIVTNGGATKRTFQVFARNGESLTDPMIPGPVGPTVTVSPGTTEVVEWDLDTRGYAWDDSHNPHSPRAFTLEVRENGNLVCQSTGWITVKPRPVILVHGFLSTAGTWSKYTGNTGFLKTIDSEWDGYAVGDGQNGNYSATMNMGYLGWPPRVITNSIPQNAAILAGYIDSVRKETNACHVDVVAHSMGGLVSRYYIQNLMPDSPEGSARPVVGHLFMLGTPNLGAWEADAYDVGAPEVPYVGEVLDILGVPAREELTATHVRLVFNNAVNNGRNVSWWGFRGNFAVPILGLGDGIVSIESARYTIPDSHVNLSDNRPVFHMSMTGDWLTFKDFVLPALSPGPSTDWDAEPKMAPMRRDWPKGDQPGDAQTIYSNTAQLPGNQGTTVTVNVPACTTALFTVVADALTASSIYDPSGLTVNIVGAGSDEAKAVIRQFAVANPTPGAWSVVFNRLDSTASGGSVSCIVQGATATLAVTNVAVGADHRISVAAAFRNGTSPITGATVTGVVSGVKGSSANITLVDDGAHGDGTANDGVYGAITAPVSADSYGIHVIATGGGATRLASGFAVVPPGPFSASDVTRALRISAGLLSATAADMARLDIMSSAAINGSVGMGDGRIDEVDVEQILRLNTGVGVPMALFFTQNPYGDCPVSPLIGQPAVAVRDAAGNVVSNYTGHITLSIKKGTGAASAVLLGQTTVNAIAGVATFTSLAIDKAGYGYVLVASAPGLPNAETWPFSVRWPTPVAIQLWPNPISVSGSGNQLIQCTVTLDSPPPPTGGAYGVVTDFGLVFVGEGQSTGSAWFQLGYGSITQPITQHVCARAGCGSACTDLLIVP